MKQCKAIRLESLLIYFLFLIKLIKASRIDISLGTCNIPVIKEHITQSEFLSKYAYDSPVVFKSISNPQRNSEFKKLCQFEALIAKYGDKHVEVSTANTHSYKKYSMKFEDYLYKHVLVSNENDKFKYGNETWYFFGGNNITEWKELFDAYERPIYELPHHIHAYSFGVAASHTGLNLNLI